MDKMERTIDSGREPEEIYEQAKLLAAEDTEESLEKAMELFLSVKGCRDAGRQYYSCRTRLGKMRWQRESAILKEFENRHEAQLKRRRKILLTSLVAVLLCFALIAAVVLVRFNRYSKADAYYAAGEYQRAAEAFMKIADYLDSTVKVYLSAVELFRQKQYGDAFPYFVWLDGYPDNGYYLRKCREKLGEQP